MTRRRLGLGAALLAVALVSSRALHGVGVPFWGARESSPIGTDPATLKPGEFVWDAPVAPEGPLVIVVSLNDQIAKVYRNAVQIGVAKVSTGKPGHRTPTGVFTILNKDRDHRSKTYDNAPMPYSERLTWDGIALHAGGIPGYPESHGCVHLPSRFAELLFGITTVGITVVIADTTSAPTEVSNPPFLAPVTARGTADEVPPLAGDAAARWEPEKSLEGPLTIVVSRADRRVIVLRNGVEIGRAKIDIDDPEVPIGTVAFVLQQAPDAAETLDTPSGVRWIGLALPGSARGGTDMNMRTAARVHVPSAFLAGVFAVLRPGSTLYVTDLPVLPETTGPALTVLNSDPPPPAS